VKKKRTVPRVYGSDYGGGFWISWTSFTTGLQISQHCGWLMYRVRPDEAISQNLVGNKLPGSFGVLVLIYCKPSYSFILS
jgi:hypothetical protein